MQQIDPMAPLLPSPRTHERWAHFRFSLIGHLLASPPKPGMLQQELSDLASEKWIHPISGEWFSPGFSTIQRWYYRARNEKTDPIQVLKRKIRSDHGQHLALSSKLQDALQTQHRQHPTWSYQLHSDNLAALIEKDSSLGSVPSYASVLRFMKSRGWIKRPRRGPVHSPGAQAAEHRYQSREVRSYQCDHVNALWHLDFHHGSLRVLLPDGSWIYPLLFASLDDCSRLCCHAQWYLSEDTEHLVHGFGQALQKRDLPRALMSDNGSAMLASETTQGLARLSILHETTLPFSPYQNGKQEHFWNQIEGRLLPMLEGVPDLTLQQLNDATQAWAEMEYNRKEHSELSGQTPLQRFLNTRDVSRPCPSTEDLHLAFTAEVSRTQRRSDGTCSLNSIRFEVPSRYGHFKTLNLRFASWDLTRVHLCDPTTGAILCRLFPQDKSKNAQGHRAPRADACSSPAPSPSGMAPLLQKIIQQYAATGLPPAYLPKL